MHDGSGRSPARRRCSVRPAGIIIEDENGYQFESANINDLKEKIIKVDSLPVEKYEALSWGTLVFGKQIP